MDKKKVNELSEKAFLTVERRLLSLLAVTNKSLFTLAEHFSLDKNEVYSWWLFLAEEYSGRDLNGKRGFTIDEGMRMLKKFMDIGRSDDGKSNGT